MDAAYEDSTPPPQCSCGNGIMKLKCAGYGSRNPGRFYYKCPTGKDHWKGFHWYDEYHQLGTQEVPRTIGSSLRQGFSQVVLSSPVSPNGISGLEMSGMGLGYNAPRGIFEFICAALCFTIFVLILGILIGKFM
ncbi:uncharacterized protein LOC131026233 [Salvia miltiorrhiza]|uniref:uncharacterized protein LOC131026233 n=1 Tax=Salvia miltiorrhiza TaxID=226208 RepID=UPI0025AD9B9F|nr:uncharacterized protein LOC131026233 [Salvia miltiorrhiza]